MPCGKEVGVIENHCRVAEDIIYVAGNHAPPHVLASYRAEGAAALAASIERVLLANQVHVVQNCLIGLDPKGERLRVALLSGVVNSLQRL